VKDLYPVDLDTEATETNPISITVMTVGKRADTESSVAAIAMLLALPSEEARKSPSHVSLKVMKPVTMACDSQNSQRLTTLKTKNKTGRCHEWHRGNVHSNKKWDQQTPVAQRVNIL
jgi:hypothetical protein